MAKIPLTRLNNAPVEYSSNDFNQLIEDLLDIIKLLNSTYPKDINDEIDRKTWYMNQYG
jgi:hypothetical protein